MAVSLECPDLDSPERGDWDPFVRERDVIARLFLDACRSQGRSIVVYGAPAYGKTALLEQASAMASDMHVALLRGVAAARDRPYAAVQRFCAPMIAHAEQLRGAQRDALAAALGERNGVEIEPLFVGLAVLHLLTERAADRPVACIVDDAHLLDRASVQVLGFVARCLRAERVALLLATSEHMVELQGLPELQLRGAGRPRLTDDTVVRIPDRAVRTTIPRTRADSRPKGDR